MLLLPACQDLDPGDLVVTQDFKGAGLYAAVADPGSAPFMQLKKCGRDSAGGLLVLFILCIFAALRHSRTVSAAAHCVALHARCLYPSTLLHAEQVTAFATLFLRLYVWLAFPPASPAGFGILGKDQAPPMFPLLYYFDAHLDEVWEMDRKQLLARQLYWYGYTMLADKSMFNWATLEVLESL